MLHRFTPRLALATSAIASLALLGTHALAQVAPASPPPSIEPFTLPNVLSLASSHAWLPLAIVLVVYARHLLSEKSKLPVTIPARWLPTVTAFGGLLFTLLVARQAGAAWGVSLLGAFTAAVASGFFDGLAVGIFGSDPTKVPGWAKFVLALVDDLGGPGTSAGDGQGDVVTREAAKYAPSAHRGAYRPVPAVPAFARRLFPWTPRRVAFRLGQAVSVGGIVAALLGLGAMCAVAGVGCGGLTPQTQAEIQAGIVLGDCIESVFAADTAKTPPSSAVQIAIDEGNTCGADVGNLVSLFGNSTNAQKVDVAKAAQANADAVHLAATHFHAAHAPAGN